MRQYRLLLWIVAALVLSAGPALAAAPVLTIAFSGNTYGYYDPCPTCGPEKLGGLARRSTYIQNLRRNAPTAGKTLVVAGAWEFLPEISAEPPEPGKLPAIVKAHERLAYDVMAVTPDEVKLLAGKNTAPPKGAVILDPSPSTKILTIGGKTVGLVFFPMPKDLSAPVPDKLMDSTAKAAASLRGKVALIVGISPWGAIDEEAFINTHKGAVDVLLGSGGGSGFASRTSKDGKTLWTRAYIKGKTINRLDLLALPTASSDFTWKVGDNFTAKVQPLDAAYPQDANIEQLF